jgi:hypothetical protein
MGIPVLVLGASGSGKSASMRNFSPDEVGVFNVASKPLPFRGKLPLFNCSDYGKIMAAMQKSDKKVFVVDDSQFLSVFANFSRAKETGYGKFVDMALNEYNLIQFCIQRLPADTIVFFLRHIETDVDGRVHAKTIGKMLDQNLGGLESMFSVCLMCNTDGNEHWFETQSDGYTPAKSPIGMWDERKIDNDLKAVTERIRAYWEIGAENG